MRSLFGRQEYNGTESDEIKHWIRTALDEAAATRKQNRIASEEAQKSLDATKEMVKNIQTALIQKENEKASGSQEADTTTAIGYSHFLARQFALRAPAEQYGLYAAGIGGAVYMRSSFSRAKQLACCAELSKQAGKEIEAEWARILANLAPHHVKNPSAYIARFKMQGVAAFFGAPLLWVAWRKAKQQ